MKEKQPLDYRYIRAWGAMLGSDSSYIKEQVELARKDKAPQNAIYKKLTDKMKNNSTWKTTDDITREDTKYRLEQYLKTIG